MKTQMTRCVACAAVHRGPEALLLRPRSDLHRPAGRVATTEQQGSKACVRRAAIPLGMLMETMACEIVARKREKRIVKDRTGRGRAEDIE